ncbi:DUF11 domain-containing protein [Deinococcus arcticus]|uniref:DUF11 domain-containing protein n=1 Tax=Deinococcus arcticus TaxID=2136176 RepID=A0A2T3WA58_9DEIO|nr:DUF11 domain-containing protein [Deinococcus arcticus]PTA68798.1 hypothetical protein C8263_06055 [Deinococcus arcticus]
MKRSWTICTLLAALAAGTASAAGTPAGTVITNTAEIVFTPEGGTTPNPPIPSNPVTTTVLPVPSFTITPNDGSPDRTVPDYTRPGQTATARPGDTVSFAYTLTNTGNVPNEAYDLTNTPDPAGTVKTPDNIRFYAASADTNSDNTLSDAEIAAATAITSISGVAMDQSVKFFQVYTVPTAAANTDRYGADPTGNRRDNPAFNNDPSVPRDANNSNVTAVARNDSALIGPRNDPDGNGNPVTPPYTSPEGLTITPSANDTQTAQAIATTTAITFTNTVQNTGNRPDVLDITTSLAGFPAGATVTLLRPDGTPLPDTDSDGTPDVGSVAPGATADLLVRVTFPAGGAPTAPTTAPTVTVITTSSNDPSKSDTTRDIVNLPGLSFGNPTPTPGGNPGTPGTPETGQPGNPGSPVIPPSVCTSTTAPTRTSIAMEIANLGSATDTFDVSGTAPIRLVDGSTVTVNVAYFRDNNGNKVFDAGDAALTDTNGNGVADTGPLAPGAELKLVAVVDVPCAASAQVITLTQRATSPSTGVSVPDTNDTVVVGKTPVGAPTKSVDKAEARPGERLTYTIIGKNTSNANVTKAFIRDTLPANTKFVSFTATSTAAGTVLYSTNGTSWSAAAITAPQNDGVTVYAGVDTNGNGTIDTGDILAPGQTITGTFVVEVK